MQEKMQSTNEPQPKHTPGPWATEPLNSDYDHDIVLDYHVPGEGCPVLLATCFWDEDRVFPKPFITAKQATANAWLIAAAPELLESLRTAINTVECASLGRDEQELPWYRMAKKAVAKAFGKPEGE